jgi:hypothetical protein
MSAKLGGVGKSYLPTRTIKYWWAICPPYDFKDLVFRFSSPVRRRVAQAGQEISARTDETTSHSTKLANNTSQVAGYV